MLANQAQQQQIFSNIATQGQRAAASSGGTALPSQSANAQRIAQQATWTFTVIIASTGVPQAIPGLAVARGKSVWLYAKNGQSAGNTKPVFVANFPAALQSVPNSQALALNPGDELPYPVENTSAIWVSGTAGDGLVVQIVSNPSPGA